MAPINKKSGTGPASKSGAGIFGKSSSSKSSGNKNVGSFMGASFGGKSSSNKPAPKSSSGFGGLGSSSSGKSHPLGASSSKSYPVSSYNTPKSKKSYAGFGIVWIPTKRHNKKKDVVYTSHNESYPKGKFERTPSMYSFMSGDSPDFKPHKKKEEETDLLMPDKAKAPIATIATTEPAISSSEVPTDSSEKPEEKQEFIKRDKEESKEAAGDTNEKDFKSVKSDDYLENDKVTNKSEKLDTEKYGDNVDSVYLRPPPPHKARSNASTAEEEDCGIRCLYYTLQCCDCVVM